MTETEIIKLVFGLFLGVGGGVLLLLAFTVGYRYLVMEQRCTCRTNGTVTGYSAVCYGGENSAVHLLVVLVFMPYGLFLLMREVARQLGARSKASA